jgi:hypothetical protein
MKESIAPVLDAQEVFNRVAKHLFEQGERCASDGGNCFYRGDRTAACPKRCAIGIFIPDAEYSQKMEGRGVREFFREPDLSLERFLFEAIFKDVFPEDHDTKLYFLSRLQNVHDNYNNWSNTETMKTELRGVAEEYSLDTSVLAGLKFKDR